MTPACVLPPYKITRYHLEIIREYTERIGLALNVKGAFNIQFAIRDEVVYVLEVNPRASRTLPFVSKATGVPLASYAAQIATGKTLADLDFLVEPVVEGNFIQRSRLTLPEIPRCGCPPQPRNALDRRSDGTRLDVWSCLRQITDGG